MIEMVKLVTSFIFEVVNAIPLLYTKRDWVTDSYFDPIRYYY